MGADTGAIFQNGSEETGRYLIFFHPDSLAETAKSVKNLAGLNMIEDHREASFITASGGWSEKDTAVIPAIGVAICSASPDQMNKLNYGVGNPIRFIRKEFIFSIATLIDPIKVSEDYLRGYRDGTNHLIGNLLSNIQGGQDDIDMIAMADSFRDTDLATWGLQATGIMQTTLTGQNVKVAILDTGIDFNHPDFRGRIITSKCFIDGINDAHDDNGHGTHCAGTLCGPKTPSQGRRFGIASSVDLYIGKVMDSTGEGKEGDILKGIGWAIENKCRIISLSLGKAVNAGEVSEDEYEQVGNFALAQNCLIIAAAGNGSERPNSIQPVTMPANATKILAVGAVDRRMGIYVRSNGGVNPNGGGVDIAGPGVEIYSSKLAPLEFGNETGTSMATPHVAGIAALLMEQDNTASAEQIWTRLTQTARRLSLPSRDAGAGLVQITT